MLLTTEIGAESDVIVALKKVKGVEEAHKLWGVYNIIASVKADTMDKLSHIVTEKIQEIGRINSKLTMVIAETRTQFTS